MPDLIHSSPQRDIVLATYMQGLDAALAEDYALAIVHLLAVLEWVTPATWPVLYHDTARALSTAYLAMNQGDPRENARLAIHWHKEAQALQLPSTFP